MTHITESMNARERRAKFFHIQRMQFSGDLPELVTPRGFHELDSNSERKLTASSREAFVFPRAHMEDVNGISSVTIIKSTRQGEACFIVRQ